MPADKNNQENSISEGFASPEEMVLKQITSKDPGFILNLKKINTVDGMVKFLGKENIHIDESQAQKLIIALRYFDVSNSGKIESNDNLKDICGGTDSNPFIGLFRSLV